MEFLSIFGWNFVELTKFEKQFSVLHPRISALKNGDKRKLPLGHSQTTFTDLWPF